MRKLGNEIVKTEEIAGPHNRAVRAAKAVLGSAEREMK
jgi:hypothetical protein